jgi:ADP-heptose:LPS heptosyltransferase
MLQLARWFSLAGRRRDLERERRRVLARFDADRRLLEQLPAAQPSAGRLLLVRLDDIGDYLLFRNQLAALRRSPRWSSHHITLLGHRAWQPLFEALDADTVDEVIWVEKNRYLDDLSHRSDIWQRLRRARIDTVIAASRTRPLLLDDLCMLAAAPAHALGCINTYPLADWNVRSDALYEALFTPSSELLHEYFFNVEFAQWAFGCALDDGRPRIEHRGPAPLAEPYLLCCLGASTRSRRWPLARWRAFIAAYRAAEKTRVFLVGQSEEEREMARALVGAGIAESLVGQLSLPQLIGWVSGARAVVSNDSMAAHLGVSLERPTVIIANSYNYLRFSDYARAGIGRVVTLFPRAFERHRTRHGDGRYEYHQAVTADIVSIRPGPVLEAVRALLAPPSAPTGLGAAPEPAVDAVPPALEHRANLGSLGALVEQHPLARPK